MEIKIKAKIVKEASKLQTKNYGAGHKPGEYVLHTCEIIEPKAMAGALVTGQRTLLNKAQEVKKGVEVGQEVELYASQATDANGVVGTFFEISTGSTTLSPEEATNMLLKAMAGAQL